VENGWNFDGLPEKTRTLTGWNFEDSGFFQVRAHKVSAAKNGSFATIKAT